MKRLAPSQKLFIGIFLFLFLFIGGANYAHAVCPLWPPDCVRLFGNILDDPIGAIFSAILDFTLSITIAFINFIIGWIAWVAFLIAGWFIDFGLAINSQLATSTLIKTGYDIVLSIANLGIIIAIVVIAFMIMLRRSNASQLLVRFILVAILMNFGLVIVTNLLIKPVDEITGIMNSATNFGPASFATAFVVNIDFGEQSDDQVILPPGGEGELTKDTGLPGIGFRIIVELASVVFSVMFLVLGTIVLFGFAGILFVRYMALAILLILLPIAWLSYIFPGLKMAGGHPFTLWWATFIKWLLFAPISIFFFFLAVKSVDRGVLIGSGDAHFLSDAGAVIGDMVVVIGLMVGGMIVANRMGIYGAGGVMKMVGKVNAYVKSSARQQAIRAASAPLRSERGEKILKGIQATRMPVVGRPIKAIGRGLISATDRSEKIIVDREAEKLKNLAPYRLAEIMSDEQGSDLRRMAALKIAQEKGYAWEAPAAQLIARAHKKKLFKKFGMQLLQNKLIAEGTPAPGVNAIMEGRNQQTVDAVFEKELDKGTDADLGKMSRYLFTDFTGDDKKGILGQHGYTEDQFNKSREALARYIVEKRPNLVNRIRSGLPGSGQTYLNTRLERYAESGGEFEDQAFAGLGSTAADRSKKQIESADPKKPGLVDFDKATVRDKQLYIQENWATVIKPGLMSEEMTRLTARTDIDPAERKAEITRISAKIDSIGPEGIIARYENREKARKGGFMFAFPSS